MIDFTKLNMMLNHVRRAPMRESVLKASYGGIFFVAKRYNLIVETAQGWRLNAHLR